MNIKPVSSTNFKSTYTIDTSSASSRKQIFTLGAMMNNFWIDNAGGTFNRIRNSGVLGKVDINVKDSKDNNFESVMKSNGISYQKKRK